MKVCKDIFYPIFRSILNWCIHLLSKERVKKMPMYCWMYTCIAALRHCLFSFPQSSVLGPSQFQTHFITMNFTLEWEVLLNGQDHSSVLHSSFPLPSPACNPSHLLPILCSCWGLILHPPIWLFYSAHCLDPAFSRTLLFVFIDGADWCLLEKTYLPQGRLCVVPECCPVRCASSLCFLHFKNWSESTAGHY